MNDDLIYGAVLRRIETAVSCGDVEMLQRHLSANYDAKIHRAVYQALGTVGGREGITVLLEAARGEKNAEMKDVIFEAVTQAMKAGSEKVRLV